MYIMTIVVINTGSLIHSKLNNLYAMLQSVMVRMMGYPAVIIGNPQVIILVSPKFETTKAILIVMSNA